MNHFKEKFAMFIDLDSCSGCHACSVACKAEHRTEKGEFRTRLQTVDSGSYPAVSRQFVPTMCQHCEDAPCIAACPTQAIKRKENGAVVIDQDLCVGSGPCVDACPYGAIHIDEEFTAQKCDLCQDRLAENESPACMATCPTDAIQFGLETEDHIQSLMQNDQYQGALSKWEVDDTKPRLYYKGLKEETMKRLKRINKES